METSKRWPLPALWLGVLIGLLLLPTSCKRQEASAPPPDSGTNAARRRGVIGVSVLTLTNPFFKEIADTLKAEAAKARLRCARGQRRI